MWRADNFVHPVMPGRIARVRAEETPGFIVIPQQAQGTLAFAAYAPVGHSNRELAIPLNLPVEAGTRQSLTAQYLGKCVKPLRIIRVGLQVAGSSHLLVTFWQVELFIGCAGVQPELTEVYRQGGGG